MQDALEAVMQKGVSPKHAAPEYKADNNIVLAAVKQKENSLAALFFDNY